MNNQKLTVSFSFFAGIFATILVIWTIFPDTTHVAILPDASVYDGKLVNGKFEGEGTLIWPNQDRYEGNFTNGRFDGQGKLERRNTFTYEGEFKNGKMAGFGVIKYQHNAVYTGEVKNDLMHGEGKYSYDSNVYEGTFEYGNIVEGSYIQRNGTQGNGTQGNSTKYTGSFKDWMYHGDGELIEENGTILTGVFKFGSLEGTGEQTKKDGTHYIGEFKYGDYEGQGKLTTSNGDIYEGEFQYGRYEGHGEMKYSNPLDGIAQQSGIWRYGKLIKSDDGFSVIPAQDLNEFALYHQNELLTQSWDQLNENNKDETELYFLGIAGDGTQSVFRREVEYVRKQFDNRFRTKGKSITLINSRDTVKEVPLATTTSIERTLNVIADKMDLEQDILFIFMTSHGSKKATLSLKQSKLSLPDLHAQRLADILKSSAIKWKVIVISSCYSGKFIEPLKNETTLIITASDKDRTSFGCADENEFTDFGEAYFKIALNQTMDFVEAFDIANSKVVEKEKTNKSEKHSNPQIHKPKEIIEHLEHWNNQSH